MAQEGFASAQGAGKGSGEDGLADLWGAGEDDHAVIGDEVGNEPVGLVSCFVLLWLAGTLKENGSHALWGVAKENVNQEFLGNKSKLERL